MLDSETTFEIKVRLRWAAFEILIMSAFICIQRVLHRKKIAQYLQNYRQHEIDQDHSKKLL